MDCSRSLACATSDSLALELDVFWLAWAHRDPVAYIKTLQQIPGQVGWLHLKDGRLPENSKERSVPYENMPFRPLGQGDVQLEALLEACDLSRNRLRALIVEQDFPSPGRSARDDAAASLEWLQKCAFASLLDL